MVIENMWAVSNTVQNGLYHPPHYNFIRLDDHNLQTHLVPTLTTPVLSGSLLYYASTGLPGLDILTSSRQPHFAIQNFNTNYQQIRQYRGYLKRVSDNGNAFFTNTIPNRSHSRIAVEYMNCYDYNIYNTTTGWAIFPLNNIPIYKTHRMIHSQTHMQTNMTHNTMTMNTSHNNRSLFSMHYNANTHQTYYEQKQATGRPVKLPVDISKWPYGWSGTVSYENQICLLKSVCLSEDTYSSSDSEDKYGFLEDFDLVKMINELIDERLELLRSSSSCLESIPKINFSSNGVYHYDNINICDFCAISEYRHTDDSFMELFDQNEHMAKYKFGLFEFSNYFKGIMDKYPLLSLLYDEPYGIDAFNADYGDDTATTKTFKESVWKNGSMSIKNIQTQHTRSSMHTQQRMQSNDTELVHNLYRDQKYLTLTTRNKFQNVMTHRLTQQSVQTHCNSVFSSTHQINTNSVQNKSGQCSYPDKLNSDENAKNRMAEFVAIGPLKDTWFSELLKGFGAKPRMKYTENFVYLEHMKDGYKDDNVPTYTYVSSEDLKTFYVPEPLYMNNLNQRTYCKYQ